jgi:hypothetical protein
VAAVEDGREEGAGWQSFEKSVEFIVKHQRWIAMLVYTRIILWDQSLISKLAALQNLTAVACENKGQGVALLHS